MPPCWSGRLSRGIWSATADHKKGDPIGSPSLKVDVSRTLGGLGFPGGFALGVLGVGSFGNVAPADAVPFDGGAGLADFALSGGLESATAAHFLEDALGI